MFILRDPRNNQVVFGKAHKAFLVCRSLRTAETAIAEIRRRTGITLVCDKVDPSKTTDFCFLRRRNGRPHFAAPGVEFAYGNRKDAWNHAGSIFNDTGRILIPTAV